MCGAENVGTSEAVSYFCENLTPKIKKLNIIFSFHAGIPEPADFARIQFEKLTERCNELIALSIFTMTFLYDTISINGISNIMKNLSQTLEKIRFALPTHNSRLEQGDLLKGIVNKTVI